MGMRNVKNKNAGSNTALVQSYLESSWDIVTDVYNNLGGLQQIIDALNDGTLGDFLTAQEIDTLAEINAIFTDFQVGRFSSQAEAEAGTDNTTTMTPLRVAQAIAALADPYADNFTATSPPTANSDNTQGYGINSFWVDNTPTPPESYRCVDATTGAAVWVKTSLTSDELAVVALSGDSDDLVEGVTNLLMTPAERTKLGLAPTTGAEIKTLYEGEADTNAFTDALLAKLTGIETGATADQTDSEIVAAYNTLVAQVTPAERIAGTETAVRRFSPADIKDMATRHSSGLAPAFENSSFTAEAGKLYYVDSSAAPITVTLPVGVDLANMGFADIGDYAANNNITIVPNGVETIDDDTSFIIDQNMGDIDLLYDLANTNWRVTANGTPTLVNVSDYVWKYRGVREITGNYTILDADKGFWLVVDSASPVTITVPSNASVPLENGTFFDVTNAGTGTVTIAVDTDTLESTDNICVSGASVSVAKRSTTVWRVIGGSS